MARLYIFLLGLVLPQFLMAFAQREQCTDLGDPAAMRRMRVLRALCTCICSQARPVHSEDGGRATGTVPAAVTTFAAVGTSLLKQLQDHEGDRVETYQELERILQGDDGCLTSGVVNRLIAEASSDMRAAQGVTGDVKTAASDVLVALARSHFHFVMSELQSHLKAMGKVPDETVLLTLGKMARSYALRCIPFMGMTLLALRTVLSQVGSGQILHVVCSVLEQWSKAVNTYFGNREQCPFPLKGVAHFCEAIYPVFRYVVVNRLDCKDEEDKQAVLGAVAAMMGVLLHEEQNREHACEQLLWLLHQYQEVRDTSRVTKSLSYVLEILEGVQTPIPQGTALAISTAVHRQLSDVTKEPGPAHKAVLSRCIMLQAQSCPEETVVFLHSQLSGGSEASCVAALGLLGALAHSDAPATREKLPQVVEAVRSVCNNPSAQVRRAVLEFIRELLSSGSESRWAWDVVGHIFIEFRRTSGRLVAGGLFACETQEDGALQALCMDILSSLDVSLRGMTKLLWPRLLQYVVPAQYSGMLIPLSCCLRALVERWERAGCKEEEEDLDGMDSQEQAQLPAPQALLTRLLVVAAAPYASSERTVAALQLLQALHGWIHRALGPVWATEIPLLLQYLEGKTESSVDSAEWEHRVLKFLRASLEPIEDKAWTVGLSQELSQQLGSSAPSSWEKFFLYKALGTALAACRDLRHVQGQVLRFLQETSPVELSEAQGMISVVSHAAESHFHLVLDTVTMFSAAFTRGWFYQTSTGWKVQRWKKEKAQGIRAALMHTYSGIALHAPKEQLLTRVDKEIMGNILRLSRAKQRDLQLKLALVQSITEVSCAIQAVGDCSNFELSSKQEATQTLLDWIKGEPWGSLVYGVFQALEELSKLRPPLSRAENCNLLAVCCQSVLSYPSKERMNKRRKIVRAAVNMQVLHRRSMEDLGHLIETLLEAEETSACFDDVVHRGHPCKQFGSLVGLLGTLTNDCLAASRKKAWVCLSYLLRMQAKTMKVVPQADEIRCLCEALNSPDTETLVETCTKLAKAVSKCIPPAQATDFLTAILDRLLHVTPARARAVWKWVFIFLVECRKEILQEEGIKKALSPSFSSSFIQVPKILNTLYTYMQQSTHRPFLLHMVFLLARFHHEPVISSLLQKGLPMDSDMVELWRSLGRSILGIQILRCLVEKLNRAGNNHLGTHSSACERHSRQTALETLSITRAISEVVLALRSTEELRQLLPHLLPSLMRWARETLGEERLLSPISSWRQLFLEGQVLEEKPCRIFLSAIELVLGKCMVQKWMRLLMNWAVWARLEDPLAHPEGVCLLSSVLLHAGLISPCVVRNLLPWLDSSSVKLRVSATAFFAEKQQMSNGSSITEFLLLVFADTRELQLLHFCLFLGIYLATLLGNGLIITSIACNHCLHTPRYFFLLNLSLFNLGSISTTVPKSMANSLCNTRVIPLALSLFVNTGMFAYLKPHSISSPSLEPVMAVLYSVVPPTLNPHIYSLRNKELKDAIRKMISWMFFSSDKLLSSQMTPRIPSAEDVAASEDLSGNISHTVLQPETYYVKDWEDHKAIESTQSNAVVCYPLQWSELFLFMAHGLDRSQFPVSLGELQGNEEVKACTQSCDQNLHAEESCLPRDLVKKIKSRKEEVGLMANPMSRTCSHGPEVSLGLAVSEAKLCDGAVMLVLGR
ncbi:maestro heat-like repeat-containing protein family member 2B [Pelecanus crispus]|uniref:maestro heat-like repeat-containing protein family member 2B n=1 Tax=Pelecanus crispus TaxID=36300 RepID=UPI003F5D3DCB